MEIVEIPVEELREASWNPNSIDAGMEQRLETNIIRNGLVQNLVVRKLQDGRKEVLSGNQRLRVLRRLGHRLIPCVVVELDDGKAKLLAQTLNHIHGEDDPGVRAELMRDVLKSLDTDEVLSVLPASAMSLIEITSIGQEDMATRLVAWQKARLARLAHMTFQFTDEQSDVVERAVRRISESGLFDSENPNQRGNAIYYMAKKYLEESNDD